MKPTAWASSCRAAVDPSRGPTTKAAAFIGRHSDRISCIPGTKSSHRIVNKWLRRVRDADEARIAVAGKARKHREAAAGGDELDHRVHVVTAQPDAVAVMGHQP